jgi:hypothetical protein
MADVAYLFHWPPAVLDALSLDDLIMWRSKAIHIHNTLNPTEAEQ